MRTLTLLSLVVFGVACNRNAPAPHEHHDEVAEQYQCPMHPAVVQDHPGLCPICNMKLVKVTPAKAEPQAKTPRFYRSPMDPKVTSPVPMKDSMGMDFVPVFDEADARTEVDGLGLVELDPARQQLIGLKTAQADVGVVGGALRTSARVAVDETRVRKVNVKVGGFIEKLYVDFVGKPVRKGQPLYSLYSPEILGAENELLVAKKMNDAQLLSASRRKLELWGVPSVELDRLEREQTASGVVTFVSQVSGVVTAKDVVEGSRVELGAMPFEIVDLSTVWVLADVYETELRFITPGLTASLRLDAWPGREWQGKVLFVDPVLDAKTRTARVRLAFSNAQGELKPEMFGEVTLAREARSTLRIPADAVVQTGTQQVVFVARTEGRFEPRVIEVGERGREFVEVLSGLTAGEAVVTRANFLVDSESRLRASLSRLGGSGEAHR
jgi:Cu(I)/Ag(I) efflux system membrane fusion protein